MKKPDTLTQLLEELQVEGIRSEAEVVKTSKAVIYLNDDAAEDEDGIELASKECALVFSNPSTVARLIDALCSMDASISLFDVTLPGHVLEALERGFVAVDEA